MEIDPKITFLKGALLLAIIVFVCISVNLDFSAELE
jgi:hypothetical protein